MLIVLVLLLLILYSNSYRLIYNHNNHFIKYNSINNIQKIICSNNNIKLYNNNDNSNNNFSDETWLNNLIEEEDNDNEDAEYLDFHRYLNEEFTKLLRGSQKGLSFDAFIGWSESRYVLDDEFLVLDDLVSIWNQKVGSIQDQCSRRQLLEINEAID
jgi:hypothetical protein